MDFAVDLRDPTFRVLSSGDGPARRSASALLLGSRRIDRRACCYERPARPFLSGVAFSRCPFREECAPVNAHRWWALQSSRQAWPLERSLESWCTNRCRAARKIHAASPGSANTNLPEELPSFRHFLCRVHAIARRWPRQLECVHPPFPYAALGLRHCRSGTWCAIYPCLRNECTAH